ARTAGHRDPGSATAARGDPARLVRLAAGAVPVGAFQPRRLSLAERFRRRSGENREARRGDSGNRRTALIRLHPVAGTGTRTLILAIRNSEFGMRNSRYAFQIPNSKFLISYRRIFDPQLLQVALVLRRVVIVFLHFAPVLSKS